MAKRRPTAKRLWREPGTEPAAAPPNGTGTPPPRECPSVGFLLLDNVSFFCIWAMYITIKAYGNDVFKVIYHKTGKRVQTFELFGENEGGERSGGASSDEKELCNLYRAKSKVRELAFCNEWEYFVTLTLDGTKQDRHDLDGYIKDLGVWIGNYNKKYRTKLVYLLIPEQHKDGAYHLHGLLHGVSADSLVKNRFGYLDMPYYAARFGFISLSKVKDRKKTASYITKYVAKAFGQTQIGLFKHTYYRSKGLQGAYTLGEFAAVDIPADVWQNDYCGIQWLDGEAALSDFITSLKGGE